MDWNVFEIISESKLYTFFLYLFQYCIKEKKVGIWSNDPEWKKQDNLDQTSSYSTMFLNQAIEEGTKKEGEFCLSSRSQNWKLKNMDIGAESGFCPYLFQSLLGKRCKNSILVGMSTVFVVCSWVFSFSPLSFRSHKNDKVESFD